MSERRSVPTLSVVLLAGALFLSSASLIACGGSGNDPSDATAPIEPIPTATPVPGPEPTPEDISCDQDFISTFDAVQ
ncbi:MAG: hypothetical protein ABGY42_15985 [bacterium]